VVVGGDERPAFLRCEALTEKGARCRREHKYEVELGGRAVGLCGPHRKQARRGLPVALATDPAGPARGVPGGEPGRT
jgi:hypothetical protein